MQVSVVYFNEVREQPDFRLDAEYYHPEFIENSKLFTSTKTIRNCVKTNIQNIKSSPINKDFQYLEISNISLNNGCYRTTEVHNGKEPDRAHHILQKNDIGVSTVRPNRNAVAFIRQEGIIGSSGLCILRASRIHPMYLYAFCKTDYFVKCLNRANKATMYPAVSNDDVLDTAIFIPSDNLLKIITDVVNIGFNKEETSTALYNQAQTILLSELGLTDWQSSFVGNNHGCSLPGCSLPGRSLRMQKSVNWFIKNYSDAKQAARIDAEYFQPKYEDIINAIKSYSGGWDTLGNLVTVKKCVEVGSGEYLDKGIPFVRVSNLSPFEITEEKYISEKLYQDIKQHQPKKGEILFSKDATPGIAYYLSDTPQKMIPSGGILRLKTKSDKINGEYLTLVLNSILTKEQVNRDVGGSVILHWRPDQVKGTIVPLLPKKIQTQIQQKVTESFNLRNQSRHLLECAKRAVEIAIEQDEQTAINWLEHEKNR